MSSRRNSQRRSAPTQLCRVVEILLTTQLLGGCATARKNLDPSPIPQITHHEVAPEFDDSGQDAPVSERPASQATTQPAAYRLLDDPLNDDLVEQVGGPTAESTQRLPQRDENEPETIGPGARELDESTSNGALDAEDRSRSLLDGLLPDRPNPNAATDDALELTAVIESVQAYFPLLQSAYLERQRTSGDQLAAWGEFDTKLKGYSENQPLGFYENYQQGAGVVQPRYRGGEVYAGYRIGRGFFEPWYLERETNRGGEFKVGFDVPLVRDREIDKRRADLWRATYDRQLAEPDIRQQMIGFVFDASITYWTWVAAGQQYEIGVAALELAERRNRQIQRRVEEGDLAQPDLADNDRSIAQRRAKLIDLERKLQQMAIKLSLFLRDSETDPLIAEREWLPSLPEVVRYDTEWLAADIETAIARRPELVMLDMLYQRTRVDLAEAANETLPAFDAMMNASQDMGEPTSDKRDKSEFELEAGFAFDMPVQRRKGFGKARSARAKLQQIEIKRQFTVDKIATEVQSVAEALKAAYGRVEQTREAVELADELAQVERRRFELGESDLLAVFLREQFAIEAADELVLAKLDYFIALAEYNAVLAMAFPSEIILPTAGR